VVAGWVMVLAMVIKRTIILSPSLNILVFLLNFAIFSAPRVVPSAPLNMSITASA
jgi:hypothetical protein